MHNKNHSQTSKAVPWFAFAFLSVFMFAGIAGGLAFFSDGEIEGGLVFMSIFCGISGLITWLLLLSHKKSQADKAMLLGNRPPEGIASNNKSAYQVMLSIGLIFTVIGLPVSYMALSDELPKGNYAVLAALLFPFIGISLCWHGRKKLQQWQKIGKTPFFPEPFPGCAGGQIGGYFTLQHGRFFEMPQAELSCVHIYQSGSGKQRTTQQQILWHKPCSVSREVDGKHWLVLDVPSALPATGEHEQYKGRIEWQLSCNGTVQHATEQLEFSQQWTLPVVAGNARSEWQPSAAEMATQQHQRQKKARSSAASQIAQSKRGDTLHLISQAGRHKSIALMLILFGSIFTGAGVVLAYMALQETAMLWLMAIIFTPLGLLILLFGLFWLGSGLQAEIAPGEVKMLRTLFGVRLYQRHAALSNPEHLQLKQTLASTDSNGQRTEFYRLQAEADSKTLVLAEGIMGRDAAEALKQKAAAVLTKM